MNLTQLGVHSVQEVFSQNFWQKVLTSWLSEQWIIFGANDCLSAIKLINRDFSVHTQQRIQTLHRISLEKPLSKQAK